MTAPKRDHLLQTAQAVFAREGFKGVSVEKLLAEAGVARMTLYKGFKTKAALIQETLRRRDERLFKWFQETVEAAGPDPKARLLASFDAAETWAEKTGGNGCYFVSALSEYGAGGVEAEIARAHKAHMLDYARVLCTACEVEDPDRLARDIRLLIEGAAVARLTLDDTGSYRRAKEMARVLLESAQTKRAALMEGGPEIAGDGPVRSVPNRWIRP